MEFSPDGTLLASASDDHTIRLWQVSDGSLVTTLRGHTAPIQKLAFSPDGTLLASASQDGTIGIWQVHDDSLVRSLQGHSESVFDAAFSTDGSLLASYDARKNIHSNDEVSYGLYSAMREVGQALVNKFDTISLEDIAKTALDFAEQKRAVPNYVI